jgi:Domain of unknown function (DUF4149)
MNGLVAIAKTFWIGGFWVIGVIVAPVLFAMLDRVTAGMVAGKLFACIACIGLGCGAILLVDQLRRHGAVGIKRSGFWLVMAMLACTVINHFTVTPIIASLKMQINHAAEGLFGGGFSTWQTISSLIYLVQSLLGLVYVFRHN